MRFDNQQRPMVPVWKGVDPFEAEVVAGLLRSFNIRAEVDMETFARLFPTGPHSGPHHGIAVVVEEEDVEAAQSQLERNEKLAADERDDLQPER